MIFVMSTLLAPIPFRRICLNWLWPSKIGQITDHGEEFVIWNAKGGQTSLAWLLLVVSPLADLSQLVWELRIFGMIVPGGSTGDQDLLCSLTNIVFKIEYLFARLNKSSIVVDSFLTRDSKKGVLGHMFLLKICRMTSMLQDSTWSTTCPNCFTNSLNDSFSYIFMFYGVLMFYLSCRS